MINANIAELDSINADTFYFDYFLKNTPCLLRGGALDWPAVSYWQDDSYLREILSSHEISQTTCIRHDMGFDHHSPITCVRFIDFLNEYPGNPHIYINDASMPSVLVQDVSTHPLLEGFKSVKPNKKRIGMFMGAGDQLAPLHYDDEENIYVLISGQKEFLLFDAAEFKNLYPHDNVKLPDFSQVDLNNINYDHFPALKTVKCYRVVLNTGDMLFVPGYWWHAVQSVGRSIALSWVRLDRCGQFIVFAKLLRSGVFPTDQLQLEYLLDNFADSLAGTRALLDNGALLNKDLFEVYLRMGQLYYYTSQQDGVLEPIEEAFKHLRQPVSKILALNKAQYSYPVLYLMCNFFRVKLIEFNWNKA